MLVDPDSDCAGVDPGRHPERPVAVRRPIVESHGDGIALYCQSENKIALSFVEGLNNKIRVIRRRAYVLWPT
jgi:Transposase